MSKKSISGGLGLSGKALSQSDVDQKAIEEAYRNIIENSPMGMHFYELEDDGRLVFIGANQAADKLLGVDNRSYIGKTIEEAFPPLVQTEVPKRYRLAAGEGIPWRTEQVNYQDQDIIGAFEVQAFQVSANKMVAVFVDITNRKKLQKTLQESEQKFRSITEQTSDLISITDSKGEITYVSPSSRQLFAVEPEEMVGRPFIEFLDESAIPLAMAEFQKAIAERRPTKSLELWMKRKDGSNFYGELNGSFFDSEQTQGTLVVIRDITERKEAEEKLKQSEERYRLIADNVADVIWTMDMNFRFTYISPSIYQLRGFSVEEAMQQSVEDIMLPNSLEKVMNLFVEKVALIESEDEEGFMPVYFEVEQPCKDGSVIWTGNNARILPATDKKAASILGVTRNISQQRQAEDALRMSEEKVARSKKMESLGLLAGGVAHDLNNVLSGIVSYPELILMELPADSKHRPIIKAILESGQRAAEIVQDLLTIARGVAITKEPISLNELIGDFLEFPEFHEMNQLYPEIGFEVNLDQDLFNIHGSRAHIRKLIINLLSNAAEAIAGSGRVVISTTNRYVDRPLRGYGSVTIGEYVVLTVSDDGSGISSSDLGRIFEPFYTKKVMGRSGTGLGLAVVWNIMLDHKGYIDVKTNDEGTTFELYFPMTRDELSDRTLSKHIDDYKGKGETILVVDDVESQRDLASKMLQMLGYRTKAVSSGEKAVEHLQAASADLVLLDMIMDPGINGRLTYEKIIEIHPNQKAIIVSGFAITDDVEATQKLGAGMYLKKPYTLEMLGLAVKEELQK